MRGFVTDYLPQDELQNGEWECIVDFHGRESALQEIINITAWYHRGKGIVSFGGDWGDVPDAKFGHKPRESDIFGYVRDKSLLEKEIQSERQKQFNFSKWSKKIGKVYEKYGYNKVYVEFSLPNGETKIIDAVCGIRGLKEMEKDVAFYLSTKLPPKSKVKNFKFTQNIPDDVASPLRKLELKY